MLVSRIHIFFVGELKFGGILRLAELKRKVGEICFNAFQLIMFVES